MKRWLTLIISGALLLASSALGADERSGNKAAGPQPLTYQNVVSFFKEGRLHPAEVQKRCTVFFEGEWKSADIYNYCLIIVENSDEDVQVTFYLTDAHEMNWVTEFVDAPFFAPAETQSLFALINSAHDARAQKLGRFRIDYHRWEPRHATILVFSFTDLPAQDRRARR